MPSPLESARAAADQRFWAWFAANEDRLFHFDDEQTTLDELEEALHDVGSDLTFEIDHAVEDGTRELVISAGGIKSAFAAVTTLIAAAPALPRWRLVAFRQRYPVGSVSLTFEGLRVDPKKVTYSLGDDGMDLAVCLYIPGHDADDERYGQIGYLLLDGALGETDVALKFGAIEFAHPDEHVADPRYPLFELPDHFDEAWLRLHGRR